MQINLDQFLTTYSNESIPQAIRDEIEAILRAEWPIKLKDKNIPADWDVTHHIVLSDNTGVLSYAAIVRKNLSHHSQTYNIIGISGAITRPDQRGKGNGRKVITEATNIIKNSNVDLALFNTAQVGLYEKFGFERLPEAKILKGNPTNPEIYPEDVFALFISEKAKGHRKDFETIPIYFGQRVW